MIERFMKRKNTMAKGFLLLVFTGLFGSVFPDSYHNITTLVGEKAAGIGGAYTAISDDPSGMFYNPAGIAFAPDNFVSISANTYGETKKQYQNVFGKGADYVRTSRGFNPNFIGTIKEIGGIRTGFSVLSPVSERFDQSDQFPYPQTRANLARFKVDYTEDNQTYLFGLSAAKAINDQLSIGITLFGFNETTRIISSQLVEGKTGTFSNTNVQDRRKTVGLTPVLGLQYMVLPKVSLGLSMRRSIVTGGSRSVSGFSSNSNSGSITKTTTFHNSQQRSAQISDGLIFIGPPSSSKIPEVNEFRTGIAYFASPALLLSLDTIFTERYKKNLNRNSYELSTGTVIFRDSQDPEMDRQATLNFATGLEFFPVPTLSLRLGLYTNKANSKKIDWGRSAVDVYLRETGNSNIAVGSNSIYSPEALQAKVRFEHVNVQGYTMGFGWETAKSSISLTYLYEYGRGGSQIDTSQLPQTMIYRNQSIYLVASSHQ
jgi:hypothetical protein